MNYEEILKIKEDCYRLIKEQLGEEALRVFKYHKGDLLPLIHTEVRKNMTCGDIDCLQWDFYKNVLRIIECKRTTENNKASQDKLLEFLSNIEIPGYKIDTYKIIADPPFNVARVIHIKSGLEKLYNHEELIEFLNMDYVI
jgi:hypothetical protein